MHVNCKKKKKKVLEETIRSRLKKKVQMSYLVMINQSVELLKHNTSQ